MTDVLEAIGPLPFVANIWLLTAVAAAALIAFLRQSSLARRFLKPRDAASDPSGFERFWSRRDGRALAAGWVVLVALTVGADGLIWNDSWEPVRVFFAILQPVAGILLVPMTAALYLFKRTTLEIHLLHHETSRRELAGFLRALFDIGVHRLNLLGRSRRASVLIILIILITQD